MPGWLMSSMTFIINYFRGTGKWAVNIIPMVVLP